MVVFGATGGLGVKLIPLLENKYEVISISSKLVDITNFSQVKTFFNNNNIDIVLNMAAKSFDTYLSKINEENYNSIIDMMNVNITGNINILSTCLPKMIEKKWGRIISISSILSEINEPKTSLYSASKSFIEKLISVANKENIQYGITCNTIQLGYWEYGMCNNIKKEYQDILKEKIGLKRWGKIEELYNTINYIIENEYVCGTNLKINGGI